MGINEKVLRFFCASIALSLGLSAATGQRAQSATVLPPPSSVRASQKLSTQEILQAAAANGKLALAALREYTCFADLTIETVSQADTITGKYYRLTEVSFDRDGNRQERNIETTSTLPKDIYIGASTANNLIRIYQFTLTPETLDHYEFSYVGREQVDELSTHVFDVQPKVKISDSDNAQERYMRGRIWIDDQDLSLVKVTGEALPEQKGRRTPRFETYFQNQDRYWFPSYATGDDRIQVGKYPTRVMVKLRFTGYRKAKPKG